MNRRRITSRVRIQLLGLLMLMGMGALGLKLWWIQVAHGQEWLVMRSIFTCRKWSKAIANALVSPP